MDARVRVLGEDVLEWSHDDFAPFSLADAPDALDVHDHQAELVVVHGPAAIARAAPGWADGDEDDDDEDVWADDRRAASEEAAQSPPARGVKRSLEVGAEGGGARVGGKKPTVRRCRKKPAALRRRCRCQWSMRQCWRHCMRCPSAASPSSRPR